MYFVAPSICFLNLSDDPDIYGENWVEPGHLMEVGCRECQDDIPRGGSGQVGCKTFNIFIM